MAQKVDENGDPVLDEEGNPVEEDRPEAPLPAHDPDIDYTQLPENIGAPEPWTSPSTLPEIQNALQEQQTSDQQVRDMLGPPVAPGAPSPVAPGTPGLPAGSGFGVYTVALPGGGEMRVDATDAASAIANAGGGGTVTGFQGWQGGAPEGQGWGRADTGGVGTGARVPRHIVMPDGKILMGDYSDEDYNTILKWKADQAAAVAQATAFDQGLRRDKFDLEKLIATQNDAYNKGLQQYHDVQLAQQAAQAAAQQEIQRQELALRQQMAGQQASAERERLDMQRRQLRPRRMAAVSYR